jgi:hypothetical protein
MFFSPKFLVWEPKNSSNVNSCIFPSQNLICLGYNGNYSKLT